MSASPLRLVACLSTGALALGACIVHTPPGETPGSQVAEGPPLRAAAATTKRYVGTAIMSGRLANAPVRALIARQFNSLSPENEMKWESIEPQPGCSRSRRGTSWPTLPRRMTCACAATPWSGTRSSPPGSRVSRATPCARDGEAHRRRGGPLCRQIGQWDVVNEALADGDSGALRDDSPFTPLGEGFIAEAFKLARQADPKAQLLYNDYEIEGPGAPKSEAAFQLCKRLKEAGVPIDGVGFQMHVDPRKWPTAEQIRANVARYAELGLVVEFTEVDVPVGEMSGTIDEKFRQQATVAHDIVAACMAVDKCTGITFWGVTDAGHGATIRNGASCVASPPTIRCCSTATSTRSRWWVVKAAFNGK